jgi:hypothetical protein
MPGRERRRIEKVNPPSPGDRLSDQRAGAISRPPRGLAARRASALILGWGPLDEGGNQALDGRREGRGTASEKFYWHPVAPTFLGGNKFNNWTYPPFPLLWRNLEP